VKDDPSNNTESADAGSANGSGPASVEAAVGSEAATPAEPLGATPAATTPPATAPPPPRSNVDKPAFVRASAGGDADAINLGTTVLPAMAKSSAPYLAAGAVGFLLGVLAARSRRR
jgi:hypothetical protein